MKTGKKRWGVFAIVGIVVLLAGGLWWSRLNAEPEITIPTVKLPKPNAHDYYVKAAKAHAALSAATPGSGAVDPVTDSRIAPDSTPQQLAQLYPTSKKVAWIKKNAPALQTLRQGFAYQYREPTNRSATALYPHYSQFRALARLMVIESNSRSEQGDWAGASRSTLDILRLGHDVPRGGPVLGALVGYAIDAIGRRKLQAIMPHLDAASARAAAREIERLEAGRFTFAETIQEEKWNGVSSLKQFMSSGVWRFGILPSLLGAAAKPFTVRDIASLTTSSKRTIMKNYVGYMDAFAAQSKLPYQKRQTPPMPKDPVNQVLLPVIARAGWNTARDESGNNLLMLQLALRAFELEKGRLPDTLNELVPGYLKKVPQDPFGSGEALRYRKTGKTYVLYSVGPDGKDDGGKPMKRTLPAGSRGNPYLMQPDSKGDYVAGVNR